MTKKRQLHPSEYFSNDYWKNDFLHKVHYKKGSRHNKVGMWIMWLFYGIISIQIVHLLTVLPWIFPALMGTGLLLAGYVVLRVNYD